jgi:hypothetical protein
MTRVRMNMRKAVPSPKRRSQGFPIATKRIAEMRAMAAAKTERRKRRA